MEKPRKKTDGEALRCCGQMLKCNECGKPAMSTWLDGEVPTIRTEIEKAIHKHGNIIDDCGIVYTQEVLDEIESLLKRKLTGKV